MRCSKNACLADFSIFLTALMIVSGLISILTAVGIGHLLSFVRLKKCPNIIAGFSSAIIGEALGRVKNRSERFALSAVVNSGRHELQPQAADFPAATAIIGDGERAQCTP